MRKAAAPSRSVPIWPARTKSNGSCPRPPTALGPLRCLINNASTFERDGALDATRASWDLHLESNLRAPFVLIQHFARQLEQGTEGNVINIIDERVWNLTPHFLSYTLSKAALWILTQTLAPALAPTIRINAIGPGPILPSVHQSAASFSRLCATLPLQRGTSRRKRSAGRFTSSWGRPP